MATAKHSVRGMNKKSANTRLANKVRDSAQDIWMAGLGAVAKAQDEGSRVFENLVAEGRAMQERVSSVADTVKGTLAAPRLVDATEKLVVGLDRLGQLLGTRTTSVLGLAGVASRRDVDALSRRVSKLGKEVEKLAAANKPTKRSVADRKLSLPVG